MVNITHSGENVEKADRILKVAQKRFGIYGLEKTSMKEIASELSISKATLYYYFPDKEHLFKAVIEMEQKNFFQIVKDLFEKTEDPISLLKMFVNVRLGYFKAFFNLSRLRFEEFKYMKPILGEAYHRFNETELEIIKQIFIKGEESKIFIIDDIHFMANLFLETLKGIRNLVIQNKELLYVEQEDYNLLEQKQNALTDVFIKSFMYRHVQNV